MNRPFLLVIAGCNGSGKSTFSKTLTPESIIPFDYDQYFLKIYHSESDSEYRERMAHNKAFNVLEGAIDKAISNNLSFCYETNFNSSPMHWPEIFRKHGYQINMIYFCLDTIDEAKRRVQIRYENGGHFVPDYEVEERFQLGYLHLNKHFREFDCIDLFDSSLYDSPPNHILSLEKGELETASQFPEYLKKVIPDIIKLT